MLYHKKNRMFTSSDYAFDWVSFIIANFQANLNITISNFWAPVELSRINGNIKVISVVIWVNNLRET